MLNFVENYGHYLKLLLFRHTKLHSILFSGFALVQSKVYCEFTVYQRRDREKNWKILMNWDSLSLLNLSNLH